MADASIGMEMNTYTIGSGMSGENLLEKDYAVMNLDTHQRIELGWISRRDHELSNFGKRFLTLLAEKLNSMQLDSRRGNLWTQKGTGGAQHFVLCSSLSLFSCHLQAYRLVNMLFRLVGFSRFLDRLMVCHIHLCYYFFLLQRMFWILI